MAATRVWKKLRSVERIGVLILCVAMLATLGIGGGLVFGSCDEPIGTGSMVIDGKTIEIDGAEYQQFVRGRWAILNIRAYLRQDNQTPPLEDEDLQVHFMLYQLAKKAGIVVTDEAVRRQIQEVRFYDPQAGRFAEEVFLNTLKTFKVTEREYTRALKADLTVLEYVETFGDSLPPTMEEIFAEFKSRRTNKRYRVEYTWMPTAPFEEKVKPEEFTEEELEKYYKTVDYRHTVPTKRQIEAAYVATVDIDKDEFRDLYARHTKGPGGADLVVSYEDALTYWRRHRGFFTPQARKAIEEHLANPEKDADAPAGDPDEPEKSADEPEDPKADDPADPPPADDDGDGAAQDGAPAAGDREPGEAPAPGSDEAGAAPDPAAPGDAEPSSEPGSEPGASEPRERPMSERERFETHWEGIVTKELFLRRLAARLRDEASRPGASLEELAGKYGFEYVKTDLLKDSEIADLPAIGFGKLRDQVTGYTDPARYDGYLLPRVLPTTDTSEQPLRRGWQVVRLLKIAPSAPAPLADVIDEIREEYRKKKVEDLATEAMELIRTAAGEEDAEFEKVVTEKGLPLRKLPFFGLRGTPAGPDMKDLESEDPDVRSAAEQVSRDYVVKVRGAANLHGIRDLEGRNLSQPLLDDASKSVILVHLLERLDPTPEEMSNQDIMTIRERLIRQQQLLLMTGRFSHGELSKRLEFTAPRR